jgi:hypothetical protein
MWIGPGGTGSDVERTLYIDLTGYGPMTVVLFFPKGGIISLRGNTMTTPGEVRIGANRAWGSRVVGSGRRDDIIPLIP